MIVDRIIVFVDNVHKIVDRFIDCCIDMYCLKIESRLRKKNLRVRVGRIQSLLNKNSLLVN